MEDLEDIVIDEIALNGLKGISLSGLWTVLEGRQPAFPLRCDDHTKSFLWGHLVQHEDIALYQVPSREEGQREDIALYQVPSREEGQQSGEEEKEEPPSEGKECRAMGDKKTKGKLGKDASTKDAQIDDPETKERGWCPCYKTRVNVTDDVRVGFDSSGKAASLQEVMEKWGDSLVLVASQGRRLRSLLPPATGADFLLSVSYYCVLEHVGSARWAGVTQAHLMAQFKWDASYTFHNCKRLVNWGLLTKETTDNQSSVYLFRFRPAVPVCVLDFVKKEMLDYLSDQPNKMAPRQEVFNHLLDMEGREISYSSIKKGLHTLKTHNLLETREVFVKDLPPDQGSSHMKDPSCQMDKAKVCCLGLQDKKSIKRGGARFQGAQDEEDVEGDQGIDDIQHADGDYYASLDANVDELEEEQIYNFVERKQKGSNGVTNVELSQALHLDFYKVRSIIKRYKKTRVLQEFSFDLGRAREMRICTQRGLEDGSLTPELQQLYQQQGGKKAIPKSPATVQDSHLPSQHESHPGGELDTSVEMTDEMNASTPSTSHMLGKGSKKLSAHSLKQSQRTQMVLSKVRSSKVIEISDLYKYMKDEERKMGYKMEMCRKSLHRMIATLTKERTVQFFTRENKHRSQITSNTIKLIADMGFTEDDPIVQATFDQVMARPAFKIQIPGEHVPKIYKPKLKIKKQIKTEPVLLTRVGHDLETRKVMMMYGYSGKMQRIEVLHKFIWFHLYGLNRDTPISFEPVDHGDAEIQNREATRIPSTVEQSGAPGDSMQQDGLHPQDSNADDTRVISGEPCDGEDAVDTKKPSTRGKQDLASLLEDLRGGTRTEIGVYTDTDDWRRYVPPARYRMGLLEGWSSIHNIIFSLPLSMLLQLVSMKHEIPGLAEFLEDPKRRNYTIIYLPRFIMTELRKQHVRIISSIYTHLQYLSGMGLVFFHTVDRNKQRMLTNFYVSPSGFFLDTTMSAPGFAQTEKREYPRRSYPFTNIEAVEQFWVDLRLTCLSTPLGCLRVESEKVEHRSKQGQMRARMCLESSMTSSVPRLPSRLPGDQRGAAGLDTSYFGHRKTNWGRIAYRSKEEKKKKEVKKHAKDEVKVIKVSAREHKKATLGGKGQKRSMMAKKGSKKSKTANDAAAVGADDGHSAASKTDTAGTESKKKMGAFFLETGKRKRSHLRDHKDLVVTQRKMLRRVKWSSREDNMLLLCSLSQKVLMSKVAKLDSRKSFVPWMFVRDMLQEKLKESYDKTTPAVTRRMRLLLKDQTNAANYSVCFADIRADESIMSEFMTRKADYTDREVCQNEFREFCQRITKKFESCDRSRIIPLPPTMGELHRKYEVVSSLAPVSTTMEEFESQDIASERDIIHSILFKIVMISMLSHHFKQKNMKEIYFVLRQYDQEHLERAVQQFKDARYMGRNRNKTLELVNRSRAMHVLPMSYQFTENFFRMLNAFAIPKGVLKECVTALKGFLDVYKKQDAENSSPGEKESNAVLLDSLEGNVASIICLSAVGLAEDTIAFPQNILSLDISDSAIAKLEKEHAEEMKKGMNDEEDDDDDFDEEEEEEDLDQTLDESRDGNRDGDSNTESEREQQTTPSRDPKRYAISVAGRKSANLVRSAHIEWKKQTNKMSRRKSGKVKGQMLSLIPRLLAGSKSEDGQGGETDMGEEDPKTIAAARQDPEQQSVEEASMSSLAMDHDYIIQDAAGKAEGAAEEKQVLSEIQEIPNQCQAEEMAISCEDSVNSSGGVHPSGTEAEGSAPCRTKSDSFFNWLAVRGVLGNTCDRKPQSIHDELRLHRCFISLAPTPRLVSLLQDNVASTAEQRVMLEETPGSRIRPSSKNNSSEHLDGSKQGSLDPQGEHSSARHLATSSGVYQTLGEMVHLCNQPFRAFHVSNEDHYVLLPVHDNTIREPSRKADDFLSGHESCELLSTLYRIIKEKGDFGVTYQELFSSAGLRGPSARDRILRGMRILIREQLVLEVGTTILRVVATQHDSKWLLNSLKTVLADNPETGMDSPTSVKRLKRDGDSISDDRVNNADRDVRDSGDSFSGINTTDKRSFRNGHGTQDVPSSCLAEKRSCDDARDSGGGSTAAPPLDDMELSIPSKRLKSTADTATSVVGEDGAETMDAGDLSGQCLDEGGEVTGQTQGQKRTHKSDAEPLSNVQYRYQSVSFVGHAWTNIDGTVSGNSLGMLLESVGLMVISRPGVKESAIFHHYVTVLEPVECLHLLRVLVNAGVITRHITFSTTRPTLFSSSASTKPKPTAFYQPTAHCLFNLTLLQHNLAPHETHP